MENKDKNLNIGQSANFSNKKEDNSSKVKTTVKGDQINTTNNQVIPYSIVEENKNLRDENFKLKKELKKWKDKQKKENAKERFSYEELLFLYVDWYLTKKNNGYTNQTGDKFISLFYGLFNIKESGTIMTFLENYGIEKEEVKMNSKYHTNSHKYLFNKKEREFLSIFFNWWNHKIPSDDMIKFYEEKGNYNISKSASLWNKEGNNEDKSS